MKAFAVATSGMGSQTSLTNAAVDSNNKPIPQSTVVVHQLTRQSVDNFKNPFNTHHRVDRVNSAGKKNKIDNFEL